jgi:type IV secretory pathway TraG/TraD family ATPase VirD4
MQNISTLKTFFLVSGIINIISFLAWTMYVIASSLVVCGVGCLFGVFPIIAAIACVMDFVAYTKLNSLNKTGTFGSARFAAIMDIITVVNGNVVSMVFGIMSLNYLNNEETRTYLWQKGLY